MGSFVSSRRSAAKDDPAEAAVATAAASAAVATAAASAAAVSVPPENLLQEENKKQVEDVHNVPERGEKEEGEAEEKKNVSVCEPQLTAETTCVNAAATATKKRKCDNTTPLSSKSPTEEASTNINKRMCNPKRLARLFKTLDHRPDDVLPDLRASDITQEQPQEEDVLWSCVYKIVSDAGSSGITIREAGRKVLEEGYVEKEQQRDVPLSVRVGRAMRRSPYLKECENGRFAVWDAFLKKKEDRKAKEKSKIHSSKRRRCNNSTSKKSEDIRCRSPRTKSVM